MRFPLIALSLLLTPVAHAQSLRHSGNIGLGVGGGTSVSGVSAKMFFTKDTSGQLVAGFWNLPDTAGDNLGASADFLFELPEITRVEDAFGLGWAVGFGGFIGIGDDFWFGIQGVVGLELLFDQVPLDLVFEYRPALLLVDEVDLDVVEFGAHLRYYFR